MPRRVCLALFVLCVVCCLVHAADEAGEKRGQGNAWARPNPWMLQPEGATLQFVHRSEGEQDVFQYELLRRDETKATYTLRERILGEGDDGEPLEYTRPACLVIVKEEVLATETLRLGGREFTAEKRRIEYRNPLLVGDQIRGYEEWWHPDFAFPLRRVDPERPEDLWEADGVETLKVDSRRLECLKVRSRQTRADGAIEEKTTWLHPEVPDWVVKEEWTCTKDKTIQTSSRVLRHWREK